jgi:hypothetical protein
MKSALAFSCISWLNITAVARTINTGNSYKEYRDEATTTDSDDGSFLWVMGEVTKTHRFTTHSIITPPPPKKRLFLSYFTTLQKHGIENNLCIQDLN